MNNGVFGQRPIQRATTEWLAKNGFYDQTLEGKLTTLRGQLRALEIRAKARHRIRISPEELADWIWQTEEILNVALSDAATLRRALQVVLGTHTGTWIQQTADAMFLPSVFEGREKEKPK